MVFSLIVFLGARGSGWRMYEKAGQSGWVSIIPILNLIGLLKISASRSGGFLLYIPPLTPFTHFGGAVLSRGASARAPSSAPASTSCRCSFLPIESAGRRPLPRAQR